MKPASRATVSVNCDAAGDIYALVNNNDAATYGGVFINGGRYELNGYLIRSQGWGGPQADSKKGLVIRGGAQIIDNSAETDAFIQYTNLSSNAVSTHIYHDLRDCTISTASFRSLDWSPSGSVNLLERFLLPLSVENCYSLNIQRHEMTASKAEYLSNNGLSGANTRVVFRFNENRLPKNVRAYLVSDTALVRILGANSAPDVSNGDLRGEYLLEGDVRTDFTLNNEYAVMIFGNMPG